MRAARLPLFHALLWTSPSEFHTLILWTDVRVTFIWIFLNDLRHCAITDVCDATSSQIYVMPHHRRYMWCHVITDICDATSLLFCNPTSWVSRNGLVGIILMNKPVNDWISSPCYWNHNMLIWGLCRNLLTLPSIFSDFSFFLNLPGNILHICSEINNLPTSIEYKFHDLDTSSDK